MSFKIIDKVRLNSVTWSVTIQAPSVARTAKPGQFIVLLLDEKGERIPLTINNAQPDAGTIAILFQEVGKTTRKLGLLEKGASIAELIGPLGRPTHFGNVGKVILVAGGVGIAEALPIARYAKSNGNHTVAIIGARTKELLILEDEMKNAVDTLVVTTDDGTYGKKGLVTVPLRELLEKERYDLVYSVGPDVMMKAVCDVTRSYNIKTIVSLDANMVDATGMCGTCRVTVGGEVKFSCVHGPEFDGHRVDWDEFLKRQKRFAQEEAEAIRCFEEKRCQKSK